jgi:AcrR family transcriptional regulator
MSAVERGPEDLVVLPARRGRPRRADADEAIIGATIELLHEVGVAGLSMDLLAQRAGVGKATIYRRWDSKEAVILHALRMTDRPLPVPDEGDLRRDLETYLGAVIERYHPGRGSDILPHLIEASCYDGRLRASLDEHNRHRQATVRTLLDRGIARGELPAGIDVDLLVDVLIGPFLYRRLITGAPVDVDYTRRLVDFALRGPAPGPAAAAD